MALNKGHKDLVQCLVWKFMTYSFLGDTFTKTWLKKNTKHLLLLLIHIVCYIFLKDNVVGLI